MVEGTYPALNDEKVPVDAPIRVRFNRFLRPDTAVRQSIRVTQGTTDKDGNPIAGEAFLEPTYDMVERVVTWRLPPGSEWTPGVTTTVTIWAARDHGGLGVRAWDGQELASSVVIQFKAQQDLRQGPDPKIRAAFCGSCDPATGTYTAGASDVLLAGCGSADCHSARVRQAGLDLSSAVGIERSARGAPAHATFNGPSNTDAPTNNYVFGVNMPLIDPGNPGNSYVLFKSVIRAQNYVSLGDKDVPSTPLSTLPGQAAPSAAEITRLRNDFVNADWMPPGQLLFGIDELRLVQAWIAEGAPTQASCPDSKDTCKAPTRTFVDYASDVRPILSGSCALTNCHTGAAPQSGVDWSQTFPANLLNTARQQGGPEKIIVPYEPDASFLYRKLTGNFEGLVCSQPAEPGSTEPRFCGDRMPLPATAPFVFTPLSDAKIATVEQWIREGAHPDAATAAQDPKNASK